MGYCLKVSPAPTRSICLAEEQLTAIGHQHIGNKCEQRLFRYGVSTLREKKKPRGLIVFGAPLDFDPGVPAVYKTKFHIKT